MAKTEWVPDRGEALMVDGEPVVVVSGRRFNERVGVLVCWPVSLDPVQDGNPFAVPVGNKKQGYGYVICHMPRTIDWRAQGVQKHPWKKMEKTALDVAMFKLDEVITVD